MFIETDTKGRISVVDTLESVGQVLRFLGEMTAGNACQGLSRKAEGGLCLLLGEIEGAVGASVDALTRQKRDVSPASPEGMEAHAEDENGEGLLTDRKLSDRAIPCPGQ